MPALLLCFALAMLACPSKAPAQPIPGAIHPDLNLLPTPPARIPIYYPPAPPAPGAEIDPLPALLVPNWNAPQGLAEYVGELFYPVAGSRLAEMDLSTQQQARIDAYVAKRRDLLATLRRHLNGEGGLPSDHAEEALRLASDGDALRAELINERFDWGAHRNMRARQTERETDEHMIRVREFHLLRASVFYGEYLTVDQRWLLWDHVLRLEETGPEKSVEPSSVRRGGLVRFLPEGSRIRVPLNTSDQLIDELTVFLEVKESLQRDIAETIVRLDHEDRAARKNGGDELARRQHARFDDLERQAETIRVGLASLPPQPLLVLPQPLAIKARLYRENRNALQAELTEKLRAARSAILDYQAGSEYVTWEADSESGLVVPMIAPAPGHHLAIVPVETDAQQDRIRRAQARLDEVVQTHMRESLDRREALEKDRRDLINAALHAVAPGTLDSQSVPRELLARVLALFAMDEINGRMDQYQTYLAATTKPGLTPGQRRLLFGEVLRELSLPLTPGVRRPVDQIISP